MNIDANRQTRQTIVRLLSSMASAKEISQYLKRFSQVDAKRFAVVKVGGAVLRDELDDLTSSLSFLQEVGLTPIVLHGAGPQLDAELSAAGIPKTTVGGLRVTTVALDPAGAPVAYTELRHNPGVPASATQEDTLVHAGHRGHGLGLWVKAVNLVALREAAPTVRRVHTWNAAENRHMLAINAGLGFLEAGAQGAWQLRR